MAYAINICRPVSNRKSSVLASIYLDRTWPFAWLPSCLKNQSRLMASPSHHRHAPRRDRRRRDDVDIDRHPPAFGQAHLRLRIAGRSAFDDKTFEAAAH